jgi:hypothetical protein
MHELNPEAGPVAAVMRVGTRRKTAANAGEAYVIKPTTPAVAKPRSSPKTKRRRNSTRATGASKTTTSAMTVVVANDATVAREIRTEPPGSVCIQLTPIGSSMRPRA